MEYSYQFQDNITSAAYNDRVQGTLNWIKENREKEVWAKDPNAYEMTNLFLFGAKYAQERKEVDKDAIEEMWQIRSKDFENCDISENHFVYQICQDSYQSAIQSKALVNDENSHHALRKMAGLGLYFKQQQRNKEKIQYHNPNELLGLLEASKTLKTFHPDLFEKYQFSKNLNQIVRLQLEQELPEETKEQIENAQKALFQEKKEIQIPKMQEQSQR